MYQLPQPKLTPSNAETLARDFQGTVYGATMNYLSGRPSIVYAPGTLPYDQRAAFWAAVAGEMEGTGWRIQGDDAAARFVVPVRG